MQNAPGKNFIFVPGILFIIFGAIGAITGLLAVLGAAALAGAVGTSGLSVSGSTAAIAAGLSTIALVTGIVAVIAGAIDIILGIIAVKNANIPAKATTVITIGYILVALQIVSFIIGVIVTLSLGGDFTSVLPSIFSLIIGLILPVLLIVGGKKNQQAIY